MPSRTASHGFTTPAASSGFTTVEALVAIVLLGIALQGAFAVHLTGVRAAARATRARHLADQVASLADSLGLLGCHGAAGRSTTAHGTISWTARHQPDGAVFDVVVQPRQGTPWTLEVAGRC
ncbi:MAG: hypothetical protein JNL26_20240 [Gemmatimonadetes bacterium]|nr:hypothetical protein [Gemmatimonadota bacterium]